MRARTSTTDAAPSAVQRLGVRFDSRDLDGFADKALSAMRKQFGGHDEKPTPDTPPMMSCVTN